MAERRAWGHVVPRPHDGLGQVVSASSEGLRALAQPGQAEVGDLEVPGLRQQQVLRLDVAVQDAAAVGVVQGIAEGQEQAQDLPRHPGRRAAFAEVRAVDEFHHEEVAALVSAAVDDGDDVRWLRLARAEDSRRRPHEAGGGPGRNAEQHLQGPPAGPGRPGTGRRRPSRLCPSSRSIR